MPGQGVTSSFNFGFTTGVIHGIIAACGIEIRTVSPQVWKRHFRLLGQPKDASRAEASRRLPQFANLWPLMKHDGRAEAALLAIYGATLE
jgi:crossover junction endodeoxyribonuclease RuvC